MENNTIEPVTDTEEAADFARVAMMAESGEPGPLEVAQAQAEAQAEASKTDATESLTGLLSVVSGACLVAGFNRTAAVWTPQVCRQVAGAAVPVLRKYPWGARILDFLETGTGAEEVALGLIVLPLAVATVGAVRADMAGDADKDAEPGQDAPHRPPAQSVDMREVHGHVEQ